MGSGDVFGEEIYKYVVLKRQGHIIVSKTHDLIALKSPYLSLNRFWILKMFVFELLRPEKKVMEMNHENIIRSLNEYMAKKAEVQIKLNETRDTLRETNSIVRIFF